MEVLCILNKELYIFGSCVLFLVDFERIFRCEHRIWTDAISFLSSICYRVNVNNFKSGHLKPELMVEFVKYEFHTHFKDKMCER